MLYVYWSDWDEMYYISSETPVESFTSDDCCFSGTEEECEDFIRRSYEKAINFSADFSA